MPRRLWLLLCVLGCAWGTSLAAAPPATQPADDAAAVKWDYEQYFAAYLNGQRIGYGVERERKVGDGAALDTFMGYKLTLAIGPQKMLLSQTERWRESADGTPLSFENNARMGLTPIRRAGTIADGQLTVTSTQGGRTLTRTQKWDPRVRTDAATRRELTDRLKADGDTFSSWTYSADLPGDGYAEVVCRRVGTESIEAAGQQVRALHVVQTIKALGITSDTWLDEQGRSVAATLPLGPGLSVRIERCSKAFAHERFNAPEILNASLVQLDKPLRDAKDLRELELTLVYRKPLEAPLALPETDRQKVVRSTTRELAVRLTRPDYPPAPAGPAAMPEPLKPYLQPTEMHNTDDPDIRRAAREAVPAQLRDPVQQARALRDWVRRHIKVKPIGQVGQGTASEVLRSRTGDCTEHAALLVALARAAGIPARTVAGLVYVERFAGRTHVLGFHAWTQLYVNGRWVDFDAAIPGEPATACRVALSLGTADGKEDAAGARSLYQLMGNIASARAEEVAAP